MALISLLLMFSFLIKSSSLIALKLTPSVNMYTYFCLFSRMCAALMPSTYLITVDLINFSMTLVIRNFFILRGTLTTISQDPFEKVRESKYMD